MTRRIPRLAYFPDSFHEVNGVAHTSRQFEAYARRKDFPFLCVRAGSREPHLIESGNVWRLELPRGMFSVPLETDLRFDPAFVRHLPLVDKVLARFRPELIHITGPSEVGMLGAAMARFLGIPLAASWHTNVHEYAARRSAPFLRALPSAQADVAERTIEEICLAIAVCFYSRADVLFAPNPELCDSLQHQTGKPCFCMRRGVDTQLFHPSKRTRTSGDPERVLGFVGRLSVEKNVELLVEVQSALEQTGVMDFHFVIVGQGAEEANLRDRLRGAQFTGILRGEELARAYADMDLFVFPSHTDTFGNVVLEALASGVPAIVTPYGGPKSIVRDGETGRIVSDELFPSAIADLLCDPVRHACMRANARAIAEAATWDSIFDEVYSGYEIAITGRHAPAV